MCMSRPKAAAPAPPVPPPEETIIETDEEDTASSKRRKLVGTRKLQIPLAPGGEATAGLRIPSA